MYNIQLWHDLRWPVPDTGNKPCTGIRIMRTVLVKETYNTQGIDMVYENESPPLGLVD